MKLLYGQIIYFFKSIGLLLAGALLSWIGYWVYTSTWIEILTAVSLILGILFAVWYAIGRLAESFSSAPLSTDDEKIVLKIPEEPISECSSESRGRPRKLSINEVLIMLQDQGDIPKNLLFDKSDNEYEELYRYWKNGEVTVPKIKKVSGD